MVLRTVESEVQHELMDWIEVQERFLSYQLQIQTISQLYQ